MWVLLFLRVWAEANTQNGFIYDMIVGGEIMITMPFKNIRHLFKGILFFNFYKGFFEDYFWYKCSRISCHFSQ